MNSEVVHTVTDWHDGPRRGVCLTPAAPPGQQRDAEPAEGQ